MSANFSIVNRVSSYSLSKSFILSLFGIFCISIPYAFTQSSATILQDSSSMEYLNHRKESILDHLIESGMSRLELVTDLEDLFKDRKNRLYKKAVATFFFEDGNDWTDSLEVRVRGIYRAAKCDNLPLKMKYSKKTLKKRGLKKRNEYKLVYPCKNAKRFQNYIYKEYLIYKLYNELTDKSFRVHLIDFTIKDARQKEADIQTTGFIVEHKEEIIKRLDANKSDVRCIHTNDLPLDNSTLFQVFQFMIGNLDWIIENCKNVEVLQMKDSTLLPIPYDFDFTGMVNPSYAVPSSKFKQNFITDRYFLGQNTEMKDLLPVLNLFKEKKEVFIKMIDSFEPLPKKERRAMIQYLKSFYRILDRPARIQKVFIHDMGKMKDLY